MPGNLYIVIYLEILFLCFLIAAVLHRKVSHDLGSEGEVRAFRWILEIYMVMMVLDSFTQLQYQGVIRPPVILPALGSAAYMALLSLLPVFWFVFAELQIAPSLTRKTWFRILLVIPGTLVAVMCFASIRTGWIFHYDADGAFSRGPLFSVQNVVGYIYFLFVTVHAFLVARKETSVARKRRLRKLSSFIIAPTIGALLQLLIGRYPFVGPSIIIAILSIFISVQADMIHTDSMTGLNNRKSMEHYLEELVAENPQEHPFYLFLIDADRFKNINDTCGHVEGDRALKLLADALRKTANRCSGFIARYGGDEFVALVHAAQLERPEIFEETLAENLESLKNKAALTYDLTVSTGHVLCAEEHPSPAALLKEADERMYLVKRAKHAAQRR